MESTVCLLLIDNSTLRMFKPVIQIMRKIVRKLKVEMKILVNSNNNNNRKLKIPKFPGTGREKRVFLSHSFNTISLCTE